MNFLVNFLIDPIAEPKKFGKCLYLNFILFKEQPQCLLCLFLFGAFVEKADICGAVVCFDVAAWCLFHFFELLILA